MKWMQTTEHLEGYCRMSSAAVKCEGLLQEKPFSLQDVQVPPSSYVTAFPLAGDFLTLLNSEYKSQNFIMVDRHPRVGLICII